MSWGGGQAVVPVDQSGASVVRKAFSDKVLGMPVATALQYWQKQAFAMSPLRPPAVKGSDAEVIAFVAKTEGAVGYVSRAAELPPEVKPVELIE
jgi:ABC-type phosphate transport system substrate-binding protein